MTKFNYQILLYFTIHIPKFVNLAMNFVTQCDYKGDFKYTPVDPILMIKTNAHKYKEIMDCFNVINSKDFWFGKCKKICS